MKNILRIGLTVWLCGFLFGCAELIDSLDNAQCMETVVKKYPTAQVVSLPNEKYKFIVIEKNGTVRYVTVPGKATEIKVDLVLGR